MIETGSAKSLTDAAGKIAEDSGETKKAVKKKVQRARRELGQIVPKKSKTPINTESMTFSFWVGMWIYSTS